VRLRQVLSVLGAMAIVALVPVSASAAAPGCTPHLDAQGPSVTISPDYSNPLQSDYSYDVSGDHVAVITCLG
jgi:hypothetical protein